MSGPQRPTLRQTHDHVVSLSPTPSVAVYTMRHDDGTGAVNATTIAQEIQHARTLAAQQQHQLARGLNEGEAEELSHNRYMHAALDSDPYSIVGATTDVIPGYSAPVLAEVERLQRQVDRFSYTPRDSKGGTELDDGTDPYFGVQSNRHQIEQALSGDTGDGFPRLRSMSDVDMMEDPEALGIRPSDLFRDDIANAALTKADRAITTRLRQLVEEVDRSDAIVAAVGVEGESNGATGCLSADVYDAMIPTTAAGGSGPRQVRFTGTMQRQLELLRAMVASRTEIIRLLRELVLNLNAKLHDCARDGGGGGAEGLRRPGTSGKTSNMRELRRELDYLYRCVYMKHPKTATTAPGSPAGSRIGGSRRASFTPPPVGAAGSETPPPQSLNGATKPGGKKSRMAMRRQQLAAAATATAASPAVDGAVTPPPQSPVQQGLSAGGVGVASSSDAGAATSSSAANVNVMVWDGASFTVGRSASAQPPSASTQQRPSSSSRRGGRRAESADRRRRAATGLVPMPNMPPPLEPEEVRVYREQLDSAFDQMVGVEVAQRLSEAHGPLDYPKMARKLKRERDLFQRAAKVSHATMSRGLWVAKHALKTNEKLECIAMMQHDTFLFATAFNSLSVDPTLKLAPAVLTSTVSAANNARPARPSTDSDDGARDDGMIYDPLRPGTRTGAVTAALRRAVSPSPLSHNPTGLFIERAAPPPNPAVVSKGKLAGSSRAASSGGAVVVGTGGASGKPPRVGKDGAARATSVAPTGGAAIAALFYAACDVKRVLAMNHLQTDAATAGAHSANVAFAPMATGIRGALVEDPNTIIVRALGAVQTIADSAADRVFDSMVDTLDTHSRAAVLRASGTANGGGDSKEGNNGSKDINKDKNNIATLVGAFQFLRQALVKQVQHEAQCIADSTRTGLAVAMLLPPAARASIVSGIASDVTHTAAFMAERICGLARTLAPFLRIVLALERATANGGQLTSPLLHSGGSSAVWFKPRPERSADGNSDDVAVSSRSGVSGANDDGPEDEEEYDEEAYDEELGSETQLSGRRKDHGRGGAVKNRGGRGGGASVWNLEFPGGGGKGAGKRGRDGAYPSGPTSPTFSELDDDYGISDASGGVSGSPVRGKQQGGKHDGGIATGTTKTEPNSNNGRGTTTSHHGTGAAGRGRGRGGTATAGGRNGKTTATTPPKPGGKGGTSATNNNASRQSPSSRDGVTKHSGGGSRDGSRPAGNKGRLGATAAGTLPLALQPASASSDPTAGALLPPVQQAKFVRRPSDVYVLDAATMTEVATSGGALRNVGPDGALGHLRLGPSEDRLQRRQWGMAAGDAAGDGSLGAGDTDGVALDTETLAAAAAQALAIREMQEARRREDLGESAVIVVAAIDGLATLRERDPAQTAAMLTLYEQTAAELLRGLGGTLVLNDSSDALAATFHDIGSALQFSSLLQQRLLHLPFPASLQQTDVAPTVRAPDGTLLYRGFRVRVGVHIGPVHRGAMPQQSGGGAALGVTLGSTGTSMGEDDKPSFGFHSRRFRGGWPSLRHACTLALAAEGGQVLVSAVACDEAESLRRNGALGTQYGFSRFVDVPSEFGPTFPPEPTFDVAYGPRTFALPAAGTALADLGAVAMPTRAGALHAWWTTLGIQDEAEGSYRDEPGLLVFVAVVIPSMEEVEPALPVDVHPSHYEHARVLLHAMILDMARRSGGLLLRDSPLSVLVAFTNVDAAATFGFAVHMRALNVGYRQVLGKVELFGDGYSESDLIWRGVPVRVALHVGDTAMNDEDPEAPCVDLQAVAARPSGPLREAGIHGAIAVQMAARYCRYGETVATAAAHAALQEFVATGAADAAAALNMGGKRRRLGSAGGGVEALARRLIATALVHPMSCDAIRQDHPDFDPAIAAGSGGHELPSFATLPDGAVWYSYYPRVLKGRATTIVRRQPHVYTHMLQPPHLRGKIPAPWRAFDAAWPLDVAAVEPPRSSHGALHGTRGPAVGGGANAPASVGEADVRPSIDQTGGGDPAHSSGALVTVAAPRHDVALIPTTLNGLAHWSSATALVTQTDRACVMALCVDFALEISRRVFPEFVGAAAGYEALVCSELAAVGGYPMQMAELADPAGMCFLLPSIGAAVRAAIRIQMRLSSLTAADGRSDAIGDEYELLESVEADGSPAPADSPVIAVARQRRKHFGDHFRVKAAIMAGPVTGYRTTGLAGRRCFHGICAAQALHVAHSFACAGEIILSESAAALLRDDAAAAVRETFELGTYTTESIVLPGDAVRTPLFGLATGDAFIPDARRRMFSRTERHRVRELPEGGGGGGSTGATTGGMSLQELRDAFNGTHAGSILNGGTMTAGGGAASPRSGLPDLDALASGMGTGNAAGGAGNLDGTTMGIVGPHHVVAQRTRRVYRATCEVAARTAVVVGFPVEADDDPAAVDSGLREALASNDREMMVLEQLKVLERAEAALADTLVALRTKAAGVERYHRSAQTVVIMPPSEEDVNVATAIRTKGALALAAGATADEQEQSERVQRRRIARMMMVSPSAGKPFAGGGPTTIMGNSASDPAGQMRERRMIDLEKELARLRALILSDREQQHSSADLLPPPGPASGGVGSLSGRKGSRLLSDAEGGANGGVFVPRANLLSSLRGLPPIADDGGGVSFTASAGAAISSSAAALLNKKLKKAGAVPLGVDVAVGDDAEQDASHSAFVTQDISGITDAALLGEGHGNLNGGGGSHARMGMGGLSVAKGLTPFTLGRKHVTQMVLADRALTPQPESLMASGAGPSQHPAAGSWSAGGGGARRVLAPLHPTPGGAGGGIRGTAGTPAPFATTTTGSGFVAARGPTSVTPQPGQLQQQQQSFSSGVIGDVGGLLHVGRCPDDADLLGAPFRAPPLQQPVRGKKRLE